MSKHCFTSKRGPIPKFPYSQAVIFCDLIFVSAQGPVDPETGEVDGDDVKSQTRRILTNVAAILEDAGSSLDNVLKVTVMLKDRSLFADFNSAYGEVFTADQPARTPIFTDTGSSLITMDFVAGTE